jgi:diguanylate cyclase (GGDEF)-like protein
VLTPFLGGWYYGGLLAGIARGAGEAGAGVIAVQTLDAGTDHIEITEPSALTQQIAWSHTRGFIAILQAVSPAYLLELQRAGKPALLISQTWPEVDLPVVRADNVTGVREAVAHLVAHGHRRIAFVGYLPALDVQERYDTFRAALAEQGLAAHSRLFYPSLDNLVDGGAQAARSMLAEGLRSTAVVCGTDDNARGLMQVLESSGVRLPDDQAVVGFDDGRPSFYLTPALTSVRQPIEVIGKTAARILLEMAGGQAPPPNQITVPSTLIVRESCGCQGTGGVGAPAVPRDPLAEQIARVVAPVQGTLSAQDSAALANAARVVAAIIETGHADHGGQGLQPDLGEAKELRVALKCLLRLGGRPEVLFEIAELASRYGTVADSVLLTPGRIAGRALFHEAAQLRDSLSVQFEVGIDLLRGESAPSRLEWLQRTQVRAGCLGLWVGGRPQTQADPLLEVVGTFTAGHPPSSGAEPPVPVSQFPPTPLPRPGQLGADLITYLVPVKNGASDWGWLALVDAVSNTSATGREPFAQWAALLTSALDRQALLSESLDQKEQLRVAALYDELTGLPNRSLFLDRLRQAIHQFRRPNGHPFAVLFLDLDGFKPVNDSLGHAAGDQLLQQVARRLNSVLRDTDTVARFGGDEFLVLLDHIDAPHSPAQVAARLNNVLTQPVQLGAYEVVVGVSIGITVSSDRDRDPEDLVRDADIAMYSAKTARKGYYAMFDTTMHDRVVGHLKMQTELRQAIDRAEFELHYQPIVLLSSGAVRSFEALIRWRHPGRGLLMPSEFMAVAEETGLMEPIGRWVINECARQLAAWRAAGAPSGLSITLNLSHRQFWEGSVPGDLTTAMDRHRLPPGSLAVEVTEGVLMNNAESARTMLHVLREMGCPIYIDDFGTGYSSLNALQQLPIDALKIDRSFVARLTTDRRSGELVRVIVMMGRNLGLDLIAEGIETASQREYLIDLGCGYGQGYLFSRAVPADAAYRLLAEMPPER